ncbi:MAG TPA: FAD-binding and (Fe-S)-binding domain-containing protein [Terriglobales bacterium]|nr:FAD-binding and (Fe-S)-binding domain-containing protein [Terriglobales bacterium]
MATDRLVTDETQMPLKPRPQNWRSSANDVNARALEKELRRNVEGEVRFDPGSKAMYAVDASNYRQVPIGVVIPKTKEDVIATVAAARKFGAPILARGGGTSLAGECCNTAIVMDFTKYMHGVLEVDTHERWARVLPGTICDDLRFNREVVAKKLTWGPDPATHNHCTFGGMLGNNSCGAHAQMSGRADNNLEELDVLLYDGTRMTLGWMNDLELEEAIRQGGRVGNLYRNLKSLRDHYSGLVEKNYPKIPRRVSGYNLDQLVPNEHGRFNVARSVVGSECTLVNILEARVKLIDGRPERVIVMLGYPDIYQAGDHIMDILPYQPVALEGIDDKLVHNVRVKGGPHVKYLPLLPDGGGWLLVEFGADRQEEAIETAHRFMDDLKKAPNAPVVKLYVDQEDREHIWTVRESGLGATAFVPGQPSTWPGWEDSACPPDKVGPYLRDLRALYDKYDYHPALYGHFGQGCIHCRVDFDLTSTEGIKHWRAFMEEATDLCVKYGGSLSGEHGDGQARGEFLYKMFGEDLIQAFREFKSIWDPDWKMNPGKVIDPYRIDENLRLGADYAPWDPPTHFKFPQDHGSFAFAALRCVGIGKCRRTEGKKAEDDTMCPSFMVTREERHTTRGRAHHLWEMLQGQVITEGWRDDAVKESLDLCLSCKGCKGDCPVNVDMATYKAEFLSHYWAGRLRPRYAYAFGMIDKWARLASIAPGFANLFTQLPGLSAVAKLAAGMPQQRIIPAFAAETFKSWWAKRGPRNRGGRRVMLWADTFNNYFFPETARAAVDVLEHAGCEVVVPMGHLCCGRPLYDYGFLDTARSYLNNVVNALQSEIEAGTPMVALEPSCCSVFRDELHGMMPQDKLANKLVSQTFTLAEFLGSKANGYTPPKLKRKAVVQGHCHHKAIMRMDSEKSLMEKMGLDYKLLESGCCGMAGSFGYEKDKYPVSIACGERAMLPAVRKAGLSTIIMADGFSCKEQISQETNRNGLHLAEVIQLALRDGEHGPVGIYPENHVIDQRVKSQKHSMLRAGIVTGAAIAGGVLFGIWRARKAG